ncbi:molecular chaperone HtpG [Tenacibaculum mesophilum]|uniref:Molecular chaperone HtpG n=1 Tax=Tenacibaculum mesophilum TaxID=104268 RepID=A0ABN5T6T5_9FLAO|nr:molecular chaperone HtpG [Tenacibaculum mesophilum]AZJ31984.1 molecular chaperone HtpG [Tenacibaculum mesophilum]QFS27241.1 molecular chaperone HtpG [Tenacibaculum mesophilum]SHF87849.1 molecular chaperone HtpG [Tenacibaculum mesophilum]
MSKGNINVSVENIFPLIKKFLYSDHEIFLRELISNGTDATTKLKHLISIGEAKTELGDAKIEISIDKDAKTLTIKDQGIGMTMDEVEKYINQIAFSGAEEFLEKYKDDKNETGVIGHFGLGFYSAFMVADKVEIFTKSFKDEPAAHWTCDGSPEYTLVKHDKSDRGTEIVLHIAEDSTEFLEEGKIRGLLTKYNRFNQVPIKFGTKKINDPDFTPKTTKDEDGKEVTEPHKQIEVDDIINNTEPAWTKKPADLEDEDYKNFYRELYPMQFEESLFHIHLNVDYPFNLTGILYFPKLTQNLDMQKDKIQLYQNQVFVTDNVEGIVPDFLQMLKGVIDSPDIPLNVSRSYLQADGAVKKISGYITKKVADKLSSLFKNNREDFEQKWNDIKVIIEYGMLSEEKFFSKAKKFALYPTVDNKFFTFDELVEKTKDAQTDKDGNHIVLYAANKDAQHSYIEDAKAKGYEVLLLDSPIVSHLMQKLEMESGDAKVQFKRVDADHIDNLIKKDDTVISKLSDEEKEQLKPVIEGAVNNTSYTVQLEAMDSSASPFIITVPEFMRRMKEMSATGGGMMGMGNMPEMYNLVVNTNHELVSEILNADEDKQKQLVTQAFDLAKLAQNLLHGEELTNFIKRSYELIK